MLDLESLTALVNDWFAKQPEVSGGVTIQITIQGNGVKAVVNTTDPNDKLLWTVADFLEKSLPENAISTRAILAMRHSGYADYSVSDFLKKISLAELKRSSNFGQKSAKAVGDALEKEGWFLRKR
jgi:hypothetical protein